MPMRICGSTYWPETLRSLSLVFTPCGIIGWSLTSSSAPVGMRLAKPTLNSVAVSMSIAMARMRRR